LEVSIMLKNTKSVPSPESLANDKDLFARGADGQLTLYSDAVL